MVMMKIVKRELGLDPEIWFERKRTEGRKKKKKLTKKRGEKKEKKKLKIN